VERTTIAGETEVLGQNLPQRHFVLPQIPHEQVRFRTPDRSDGKPANNRLSYGAASLRAYGSCSDERGFSQEVTGPHSTSETMDLIYCQQHCTILHKSVRLG
jgi:hypothetical protein